MNTLNSKFVRKVSYRPFDDRSIFYTGQSRGLIGQPAAPLAEHLAVYDLALGTTRRVEEGDFRHAFVFANLPDGHSVSSKETTHVFPLYLKGVFGEKTDNWKPEFKKFIKTKYGKEPTPEVIFGYIYAVVNAPVYRDKFEEFLADDYARIPFPEKLADFNQISKLGWALIQAHTLKNVPVSTLAKFQGKGTNKVEFVRYSKEEARLYINESQYFSDVSDEIWSFFVGGYHVLERYLKARVERELTLDEIDRVTNIAAVIDFSIKQMAKIDSAYGKAFPG
jgi:predicted helicase